MDVSAYSVELYFKVSSDYENKLFATAYQFTSNKILTNEIVFGDRVLSLFVIGNIMHFSSYDLNNENPNFYYNIEFEACDLDKWIFAYFGYSFKL